MTMRARSLLAAWVVLGVACAGPSSVEASIRDAFVDCMSQRDITVHDVEVSVRDGRHVDTLSWDHEGDIAVDEDGQDCEDAALRRFEVSRT